MNLESEILCGYEVPASMKRIWAMELDMVRQFVDVCEKYQLQYWIMGGTLLGAVRHKGFIPWDNDIDLAMPRNDFNKLLKVGPEEFKAPYFFQTPVTEQGRYFCTYVKLRNGNGTAAARAEFDAGINCGLFIDIFCLDEIPNNQLVRKFYCKRLIEIAKMQRFALGKKMNGGWRNNLKHALQKFVYSKFINHPDTAKLYEIYQKEASRYAGSGTNHISHLAFGYHPNFVWKRSDWMDTILLDFEDMKLCAPKGYAAILTRQYGDYMQIPEDKSTHDYFEFSADIPYNEYFLKH